MYIFLLGYHVTGIHSSDEIQTFSGADPGFFLEGGALVSCSTSTPINHIVFFFLQNTSCIRKPQVISGGVRTPCTLPLDPPLILLGLSNESTQKIKAQEVFKQNRVGRHKTYILLPFSIILWRQTF